MQECGRRSTDKKGSGTNQNDPHLKTLRETYLAFTLLVRSAWPVEQSLSVEDSSKETTDIPPSFVTCLKKMGKLLDKVGATELGSAADNLLTALPNDLIKRQPQLLNPIIPSPRKNKSELKAEVSRALKFDRLSKMILIRKGLPSGII